MGCFVLKMNNVYYDEKHSILLSDIKKEFRQFL